VAALPVAVLDANVLVPILSCDLLLTCFDHDLHQPVVTLRILHKIDHSLAVDFPQLDPGAVGPSRPTNCRDPHASHTSPEADATPAVDRVNAKDRHVAATGLATRSDLVVTNDRRLRREINAPDTSLRAVSGDEFVVSLHRTRPNDIDQVLEAMVAKRTRQPVARSDLLHALATPFPRFVAEVGARQD